MGGNLAGMYLERIIMLAKRQIVRQSARDNLTDRGAVAIERKMLNAALRWLNKNLDRMSISAT
jgi:hypothetical protein